MVDHYRNMNQQEIRKYVLNSIKCLWHARQSSSQLFLEFKWEKMMKDDKSKVAIQIKWNETSFFCIRFSRAKPEAVSKAAFLCHSTAPVQVTLALMSDTCCLRSWVRNTNPKGDSAWRIQRSETEAGRVRLPGLVTYMHYLMKMPPKWGRQEAQNGGGEWGWW